LKVSRGEGQRGPLGQKTGQPEKAGQSGKPPLSRTFPTKTKEKRGGWRRIKQKSGGGKKTTHARDQKGKGRREKPLEKTKSTRNEIGK